MKISHKLFIILILFVMVGITQTGTVVFAQENASEQEVCLSWQKNFTSAIKSFETAYFKREGSVGTAEDVYKNSVLEALKLINTSCPSDIMEQAKGFAKKAEAMMSDPNREQNVLCDKKLIAFQSAIKIFDTTKGGADDLVKVISYEIEPAAKRAIAACPQIPNLTQQTQQVIQSKYNYVEWIADNEHE